MARIMEKVERRLGEKLFLKGSRCVGPKCAAVRRAYPPGLHGKKRSRSRSSSDYGFLLKEKQKLRFLYGIDNRELERYSKEASSRSGVFSSNLLGILERRLDNAVFRLGFAESRRIARQFISHGHITVKGRIVRTPSYQVKNGEVIGIKEGSLKNSIFSNLDLRLKKYDPPAWLRMDAAKKEGFFERTPEAESLGLAVDVTKIKEFYSR